MKPLGSGGALSRKTTIAVTCDGRSRPVYFGAPPVPPQRTEKCASGGSSSAPRSRATLDRLGSTATVDFRLRAPVVWMISEVFWPEEEGTGHYMTGVAEKLAEDFEVHALCGQPSYSRRGDLGAAREDHAGVHIERCRGTLFNKNVLLFRVINAITLSLSIGIRALRRLRRGDIALVVTNPPLLPFFIAAACRLRGARLLLRLDDVYPDAAVGAGLVRPGGLTVRLANWATRYLYESADLLIVLGRCMRQLVSNKADGNGSKIRIIPIWAEVDDIKPQLRSQSLLAAELGLSDHFIVQIAGNIGRLQDIETIAEAAIRLRNDPRIRFVFVGAGAKLIWLKERVAQAGVENVKFVSRLPRSRQQDFLNACDVAIVSLKGEGTGVGVPSRLYNHMAAGKAVIGLVDARSETALVIEEERMGWVVPPGDVDELAAVLCAARDRPQELAEMGRRSRRAAEQRYSRTAVVNRYTQLVSQIMEPSTRR